MTRRRTGAHVALVISGLISAMGVAACADDAARTPVAPAATMEQTARRAAINYAVANDFPNEQIDRLRSEPPWQVREVTAAEGGRQAEYRWLGTGKGGWFVVVLVDTETSDTQATGGYSSD